MKTSEVNNLDFQKRMSKEISRFSGKGQIDDWLSDTQTIEGISP